MASWQVSASADDCTCDVDVNFMQSLTNDWWGFPRNSSANSDRESGARFLNVTIPKDSTINSAYITGVAYSNYSNTINCKIYGEQNATPATFSTSADYQGRTRTTASVDWDVSTAWTSGTSYNTSDISTIIQEIVNLAGWASGNNLVIFIQNDGTTSSTRRNFRTYDYSGNSDGPTLTVTFTPPASGVSVQAHQTMHIISKITRG